MNGGKLSGVASIQGKRHLGQTIIFYVNLQMEKTMTMKIRTTKQVMLKMLNTISFQQKFIKGFTRSVTYLF